MEERSRDRSRARQRGTPVQCSPLARCRPLLPLVVLAGAAASLRGADDADTRVSPTVGNPNPWAALFDADDFHEGFEDPGYTAHVSLGAVGDLRPLGGQVAPNGNAWMTTGSTPAYNGIVDNALAQTGPDWNPGGVGFDQQGVAGGPDPSGSFSRFLASPRGSVQSIVAAAYNTSYEYIGRLSHAYYRPTNQRPLVVVFDMYRDKLDTAFQLRLSNLGGPYAAFFNLGGYDVSGQFDFENSDGVFDRPYFPAVNPNDPDQTAWFVAGSHVIKTDEWFSVALRIANDSYSIWIRDSETIGAYGFTDDSSSLYPGDTSNVPGDGLTPFAGEIFEQGWAQIFPGLQDDPATPLIEGSGSALTQDGFSPAIFQDVFDSPAGEALPVVGVARVEFIGGFDPPQPYVPGFQPSDFYIDNYTVMGTPFCFPDPSPDEPRRIDGADLATLLSEWGPINNVTAWESDLDGNGVIDGADLAALLALWGAQCSNNEWQ